MKKIERTYYLNRLKRIKDTPDIKIITGIRRSGKSELMKDFIEYIKSSEANSNVIYIDFYNLEFESLKNYLELNTYIKSKIKNNKKNYLFIDEVQLCKNFEIVINSIHNSEECDIYITGSNAFLLSSDLSTLFTGRYIEIEIYPFSFGEFCKFYNNQKDKEELLDEYLIKGGLAGSYLYSEEVDRIRYISDVFNTIINRDLVLRYNLPETMVLDHLTEFLMDNISNMASPNNISEILSNKQTKTNHVTVGNYIKYLCNAFVFYDIKSFDIKGKKYLETNDKFYLCDLGFRFSILGMRNIDFGRCYENIVCIELLRRGYKVYIGKLYQKEIDFVAIKGNEKIYFQVSDNISNVDTFSREVKPLLQIKDAYPKILIARTKHQEYLYEGIRVINLSDRLLQNYSHSN